MTTNTTPSAWAKRTKEQKLKLVHSILIKIENGMSVRKACAEFNVSHRTFLDFISADEELSTHYARAKLEGIEKLAEELLEISDTSPRINAFGNVDSGDVNARRLQIDTRKWLLSKLAPKKYGDRLELVGDAENPLVIKSPAEMTEAELDAIIAGAAKAKSSGEDD